LDRHFSLSSEKEGVFDVPYDHRRIRQDQRSAVSLDSLESVVVWLSREATPALKRKFVRHVLYEDADNMANRARKHSERAERGDNHDSPPLHLLGVVEHVTPPELR
jgi:hypothetical protein